MDSRILSLVLLTTEIAISWFIKSHYMTLTPDIMGSNHIEYLKIYIYLETSYICEFKGIFSSALKFFELHFEMST